MNLQKIESEVGQLPRHEQRQLMRWLITTLDTPTAEELRTEWLQVAARRAEELDSGVVTPISAEDVMKKARALIR